VKYGVWQVAGRVGKCLNNKAKSMKCESHRVCLQLLQRFLCMWLTGINETSTDGGINFRCKMSLGFQDFIDYQ
jgi:hypothetical protein